MMKWSYTLIAGSALILLTNAVALLGAAYNRSDDPESQLQLSQRELRNSNWNAKDNSGVTLDLKWRIASALQSECDSGSYSDYSRTPAWLNKTKMSELGFDVAKLANTPSDGKNRKEVLPREALLVLELNGAAYMSELQCDKIKADRAKAIQAREGHSKKQKGETIDAIKSYQIELEENSRLFVIDAGLDLQKLRASYPDRTRYAIVHGLIRPNTVYAEDKKIDGYVSEMHAEHINVPLNYRQVFEKKSLYEVTVAFGKRLEPWVINASKSLPIK